MKEKIVELLVYFMSEIRARSTLNDIDLGDLKKRGYTQSEISEALSWLYENMRGENGVVTIPAGSSGGSRRVLHEVEKAALTVESQGYLIQLRELGLLDDRDMETVIERAVMSGYESLSVDELREIVASVLFGKGGDARRSQLNNKETIH